MLQKTTSSKRIRYRSNPQKDEFIKVLRKRVWKYFEDNNISKHANAEMYAKSIFAVIAWFSVYGLLISNITSHSYLLLIGTFCLLGFINIFIAFNVVHDACHDAYTSSKKWNKILGYSMDLIGGNSYLFTQMHNAHHAFVNIHGSDVTLETHGQFRFSPEEPWLPKHRWQHIYTPILYSLASVHWVFVKDFKWFFFEDHIGNNKNLKHPTKELVIMLLFKALYATLYLILPFTLLSAPWWVIFIGFLMMHIPSSLTFALVFQVTHVYEGTHYPLPDDGGNIDNNYAIHVLETTADFSRNNAFSNWFLGCINIHVIHHIMPGICHVHYPELTKIVKQTAEDFGIEYKESPNFWAAWKKHLSMLKLLSKPDATVPQYGNSSRLGKGHKVAV